MATKNRNNFVRWQGNFNTMDQCEIAVTDVVITRSSGAFVATFSVSGTADHYLVELNDGSGYVILESYTLNGTTISYNYPDNSHMLRITPYCTMTQAGIPGAGSYVPVPCMAVVVPGFTLPAAVAGQPYSYNVSLTGTPPFSVTPASYNGISVGISGSTLTFTGTPTAAGTGSLSFTVSNACGSVPLTKSITVAEAGNHNYQLLAFIVAGKNVRFRSVQNNNLNNVQPLPFATVVSATVTTTAQGGGSVQTELVTGIQFAQGATESGVFRSYPDGERVITNSTLQTANPESVGADQITNIP